MFNVSLTAHLDIILVNIQLDALFFNVFFIYFTSLHVSSTQCSSSGELNCINTASVIFHTM